MTNGKNVLPIFSAWLEVVDELLEVVSRLPRNQRPALGQRLADRGLEVLETLVDLRYSRDRAPLFQQVNRDLEKLRVLTRVAFRRRGMAVGQYERLAGEIDRCGRMLGGWARSIAPAGRESTS